LPFTTLELLDQGRTLRFRASGKRFDCVLATYVCSVDASARDRPSHHVISPDGGREAFIHAHDLWIRPAGGGDSTRLTTDGEEFYGYGDATPRPNQLLRGDRSTPWLEWSLDSRRIAVARHDERGLGTMPMYSSTTTRPRFWQYPYGLPGDSAVSSFEIHLVDIEGRSAVRVDVPSQPWPMSGLAGLVRNDWITVKWSADSRRFFFTHHVRARKRVQLMEADIATGRPLRTMAKDTGATYVELNQLRNGLPNWFVREASNEVLWQSERDGWAHLYRFDMEGNMLGRVTAGAWPVAEVKHIDERTGGLYFTARGREPGRNPYFQYLYRTGMDGAGMTLLTPEDADHVIDVSPSGRFFVDRYARPDGGGATVLRASPDVRVVLDLEALDVSQLEAVGWIPPEVITVKARDGVTDLWGLLFRPKAFDPTRAYPIIVNIYPGPQIGSVGVWTFEVDRRGEMQALAELGFIVVQVDALGTPYRSKAFHDAWYGNMGDNGIPDQIAAVQQLAARHPWIDVGRVGIFGHSGGGFSSTGAIFRYPDFFKVAVSTSGNHDNRSYGHYWAEQYQGPLVKDTVKGTDNYLNQVNALHAANLRGKLLLMHGDLDDNVHPAMTLQVVDALVKANKTFDLVILPDRAHGLNEPYVIRRRFDYFVQHLLGAPVPKQYEIRRAATS
jgi:dienelactone hydrolase